MHFRLGLIALTLSIAGCSSARVYDNSATAAALDKALVDAGEQMRTWRDELNRHRRIAKMIESKPPVTWAPVSGQGRALLKSLETEAAALEGSYRALTSLRAEFSAFAHAHPRIYSHEPKWTDAENRNQEVITATASFNQGLRRFTAAAHGLNGFWSEHRLFQRHNAAELAAKIHTDTQTWREDYNQLVTHFNQGQTRFSDWQMRQPNHWNAKADSALHPLRRMHHYLGTISKLIQDLDKLKASYFEAFGTVDEIDSLDPRWKRWSEMRTRLQELSSEFKSTKEWYQNAYDELVSSITAKAPLSAGTEDQKQSPQ